MHPFLLQQQLRRKAVVAAGEDGTPNPLWADTVLLLHFDGDNEATATTDETGRHTVSFVGGAELSTAQEVFGASSLSTPSTGGADGMSVLGSLADFDFGTEDFTIEGFFRSTSNASGNYQIINRKGGIGLNLGKLPTVSPNNENMRLWQDDTTTLIDCGAYAPPLNEWVHFAICRESGNTRVFFGGVQVGSTRATVDNFTGCNALLFGSTATGSWPGYRDELRIIKGVGLYSGNFTPPAAPFPGEFLTINYNTLEDSSGVLLLESGDKLLLEDSNG